MDSTYIKDLSELRIKFEKVDKNDPESLRNWFNSYNYLSTNDFAQIANRSVSYIRRLKKKANIIGKMPPCLPKSKATPKINNLIPPENWDTYEWFNKVVGIYSVEQISKACNISRRTVGRRLAKYGLRNTFSTKSNNKCCTKAWCYKYYVELGWSQDKCAKKAGVCQQTFANWLNRFKIPVRTARESLRSHTNVQLWVRELIDKLKKQSTVRKVFLRDNHIHVRFKNYFWETYYVNKLDTNRRPPLSYIITKEDAKLVNVPQVYSEYESDILNAQYDENGIIQSPHIIINRKEFIKSSLIEQRLAAHEFCRQITQRNWMWPEHPEYILLEEWDKLQKFKPSKYINNDTFSIFVRSGQKPAPGRRLIEHFFDISEFSHTFKSPRLVMKMINKLASRNDLIFNFHNLLRIFSCGEITFPNHPTFRMFDPAAYTVLFRQLGIKGRILDLKPGFGNRAIASAMENLEYYTISDTRFKMAINKGFDSFIGLNYHEWNNDKVDVLIYDDNFNLSDMKKVIEYTKYAKRMLVFVPHSHKLEYQAKFKPQSMIKIKTKWFQKSPDYIFIW